MFASSHAIALWFKIYATQVPLGWFVFAGSFLEEMISPIPAMLITGIAGSIALVQHYLWWQIGILIFLASLGKTLGAWIYYMIGDKAEDILIGRVGKWFGVTHADVERVGKRFEKHHALDGGVLFVTRVLPFMPTTPFSLASGIFKMNIRLYLSVTMLGYFIKDTGYISIGYFGLARISTLWKDVEHIKAYVDIFLLLGLAVFLYVLYQYRREGHEAWRSICRFFTK